MGKDISLKERCHINTNIDGDRFVGVKADADEAIIYFPIGYQLPEDDKAVRNDIMHLIDILATFTDKKDRLIQVEKFAAPQYVDFPINAYIEVIHYQLEIGAYVERDSILKVNGNGNLIFNKTIASQIPMLQMDANANYYPIYLDFITKESRPNFDKEITRIYNHCAYEAFNKLGWLFTPYRHPKPEGLFEKEKFLNILRSKLGHTNNDRNKRLFKAMIDMINYLNDRTSDKRFYFGTDHFETVWEKLIDSIFGIKNKNDYFPKAKWSLRYGKDASTWPLQPDSIMLYKNKLYVLDAKYYKYGITKLADDLPNASSINKQITYGEYILENKGISNENLFNAFIMPFNMHDNLFDFNNSIESVGEATGDWRKNDHNYEHIQGILIDTRTLMYSYINPKADSIVKLAEEIEKALEKNKEFMKN